MRATTEVPQVVRHAKARLSQHFDFEELERRALTAEDRAIDAGRHARIQVDGSFLVCSETDPRPHNVITARVEGLLFMNCTCESGAFRNGRLPVHCRHGSRVGLSLVRRGKAIEHRGLFYAV